MAQRVLPRIVLGRTADGEMVVLGESRGSDDIAQGHTDLIYDTGEKVHGDVCGASEQELQRPL